MIKLFETVTHLLGVALTAVERIDGLIPAPIIVFCIWKQRYRVRNNGTRNYNLDPQGKPGGFEPLLQKYLHLAEFTISLATGSIVLLIGASFLHGKDGRLPPMYTGPLLVLSTSVITAIFFMVSRLLAYEDVQHGNPHTPETYALNETLGFSSLTLFVLGYLWLIFAVTA
jgi:hypothetical protein